jgi:hypothetical protein
MKIEPCRNDTTILGEMQYSIVLNALKLKYEVFFKGKMRRKTIKT